METGKVSQAVQSAAPPAECGCLATPGARYRLYAGVAVCLFFAAIAIRAFDSHSRHDSFDFIVSDARGYYVYLPAIVIEGNLRFEKQITQHWGRERELGLIMMTHRTPRGYVVDKYPAGLAMTVAPSFLIAHAITRVLSAATHLAAFTPDGYTIVYQILDLIFVLFIGWAMMVLCDKLIIREFTVAPYAVAAGIVLYWVCSNYVWYYFREPFMIHIVSAFWVVSSIYLLVQIVRDAEAKNLRAVPIALLGFTFGISIVCRPTNAFITPVFVWALYRIVQEGQLAEFLKRVPAGLTILIPTGVQMALWYRMSGSLLYYSYGHERFYFLHPALWQTLFHTHHGLFLWSPILLLSVLGIAWGFPLAPARGRQILAALCVSGVVLWYVNSSWWAWWFGWAFGARAWIELAPLFIMGLVFFVDRLRDLSALRRQMAYAAIVFSTSVNFVLLVLYQFHKIQR
jgi:hypothetical protein